MSLTKSREGVPPRSFYVHKGSSVQEIAHNLEKEGWISWSFPVVMYVHAKGLSLRKGEYLLGGSMSELSIVDTLAKGRCVQHYVTIPEGLTKDDILKKIQSIPDLDHSQPLALNEGEILPETYAYEWSEPAHKLLARMKKAGKKALATLGTPLPHPLKTMEEVVVLASIVEKETPLPMEQPHVAGVFLNRLKKGMPLQSDVTVLYALGEKGREPNRHDLLTDSPYNTYINRGLPPGPICTPGYHAIQSVMHPLETDDLYFVADNTGGHVFASTLKEHQKNHQQWRQIRRENLARQKRTLSP